MFFRRENSGRDRWLQVKIVLFSIGAVLAVVGMLIGSDWMIWAAVAVLAFGVLLRLLPDRED